MDYRIRLFVFTKERNGNKDLTSASENNQKNVKKLFALVIFSLPK